MTIQAYPLAWPFGWPRVSRVSSSNFGDHSIAECVDEIKRQLHLLGATGIVISSNLQLRQDGLPRSNQSQPRDVGAAVYFELPGRTPNNRPHRVLACDRWIRVEDNLWAIARHIDALRGQQRWGVGSMDQAFAGYTALPPGHPASPDPWWSVLGVGPTASDALIRDAYRELAKKSHPDMQGGDTSEFQRIQQAYESALRERRA